MEIYFVRHGQTDGNVARRHQHPNIGLNENGKVQIAALANKIARLRPTHLITSSQVRAVETARAIAQTTNLIPETYPYFEELRRPEYLVGERMLYSTSIKYILGWFFDVKAAPMHDGESYADFLARLALARQHLVNLPDTARVVVVSHAVFINFFLEHMNRPERMGVTRAFFRFFKILRLHNTDIVHITYNKNHQPQWHQHHT